MKELNIVVPENYINFMHYLKDCVADIKPKVYTAVCVINDMAVFSVATSDEEFVAVEAKLKVCLPEVIIYIYKEKFLNDNINFGTISLDYRTALLKALVLFDSDSDKKYIKQKLDFSSDLYLDSVYNFKLTALKKRWAEVVELTNENKDGLLTSDTFLDLLKFLIATIKPKTQTVNVYYNGKDFEYKDKNQKIINRGYINPGSDEINLITTLITLAPCQVNLHCINSISNTTFKVLYYIFDKKVDLLVWCIYQHTFWFFQRLLLGRVRFMYTPVGSNFEEKQNLH